MVVHSSVKVRVDKMWRTGKRCRSRLMYRKKKHSKKQGKVVEVTGVGPKDDYTSNGAMACEQKGRGGGLRYLVL